MAVNIDDQFWAKTKPVERTCIEWIGRRSPYGYGQFHPSRKINKQAHRFAWEIIFGPIPEGVCVLHRCDNRACVNPDHLFLGTSVDNQADKVHKGRQARGEAINNAKLTEDQVKEIREISGVSQREIAKMFGIHQSNIYRIRSGRTWRHINA